MSRRGGKRRPVLQLGNSSSKLHRYGYSKEFHSKDKRDAAPTLVGDYSDSDTDNDSDNEQVAGAEIPDQEESEAPVSGVGTAPNISPSDRRDGVDQKNIGHMDDELKSFLSEIEAIPMPADMMASQEQSKVPETDNINSMETESKDAELENNATAGTGRSKQQYSMFVKGEPEFVNNTNVDGVKNSGKETKEVLEEIPEEPTSNWQMVQDETTQYYYYWNIVTNEVTWEIPTEYTQFLLLHKEYEEKMAKFTPEQLKVIQDRRMAKEGSVNHSDPNSAVISSVQEQKRQKETGLSALASYGKDDPPDHSRGDGAAERLRVASPALSLSPRPDGSGDTRHHKHKKEKRSHHKKKHKRRHSDSDPEESKPSPKMPDIGPPNLSDPGDKASSTSQKFASIVPYLSDQEDDFDNENENSNPMPELGPPALSDTKGPASPNVQSEKDPDMPDLEPAMASGAATSPHVPLQESFTNHSTDMTNTNVLLLPPPPPPPEEDKEKAADNVTAQHTNHIMDESHTESGKGVETKVGIQNKDSYDHVGGGDEESQTGLVGEVNEILNALADPGTDGGEKDKLEIKPDLKEGQVKLGFELGLKQDSGKPDMKDFKHKKREKVKKEVLDMFAEDYPIENASSQEMVSPATGNKDNEANPRKDLPGEKANVTARARSDTSSTKSGMVEDIMEEGEISESTEKETTVCKKVKTIDKNTKDEDETKKKPVGVLNIVGYGSDDEEEEGELKENEIKEDERHSSRKKKKEKKKDSKKHKRDVKAEYSFMDGNLDKEILSKMSETIDQTISKIVTQTVNQAVSGMAGEKPAKTTEEDGDIDFEDLDDIDRALEVALERKLEKKKVELAQIDEKEKEAGDEMADVDTATKSLLSAPSAIQAKKTEENAAEQPVLGIDEGSPGHTSKKRRHEEQVSPNAEEEEKLKTEMKEMAELALNKLEFLDISTDNLSRLQVLFIELQTRQTDWLAGGLSSQYFYEQLKVAESLLEQYELSAVPEGWACQWDRANNRYYYRNKATSRIQWEYPQVDSGQRGDKSSNGASKEEENAAAANVSEQHKSRSSSSRHRKRDDKDRGKYDKRSSSHRYRRKRRRRRDHSSSSNSSDGSQQHRHHHKSKKKKRYRTERSPSVEIVEDVDGMDLDEVEITESTSAQPAASSSQPASNAPSPPSLSGTVEVAMDEVPPPPPSAPPPEEESTSVEPPKPTEESDQETGEKEGEEEETKEEPTNAAVISKPPQIIVPPQLAAAINPEHHTSGEMYLTGPTTVPAAAPSSHSAQGEKTVPSSETATESAESHGETDKQAKKKKKDKKPLATGSSIMMKKKHLSSMVQKWQNVKKEVEKEDRAKELRQAAIRKKIEELK